MVNCLLTINILIILLYSISTYDIFFKTGIKSMIIYETYIFIYY